MVERGASLTLGQRKDGTLDLCDDLKAFEGKFVTDIISIALFKLVNDVKFPCNNSPLLNL